MITYEKDGATLVNGAGETSNPMDGAKYSAWLATLDRQVAAASANAQAVSNYNTSLANAQMSVSAGRPGTAPPKPLETVVNDDGSETYIPFSPTLADLIPLNVNAPSTLLTTAAPAAADTQALMFAMIQAIYRKQFPST